jgi:colanic acid biosynthesis glycosyl transferase WcaI
MSQLAKSLVERGHEISVITTFPHYEGFRTWPEYRGKVSQRTNQDGIDVLRVYSYTSGSKSMKPRLVNYLTFNVAASAAGLVRRDRYDLVFCTNGSFFSGVTGFVIGRVGKIPVVYNVQDLYPEVPIRAGQLTHHRAIATLERVERFMYDKATHVSVIAPSFEENLARKGVPGDKISVIPNFVDTDFIRPLPKDNEFSRAHRLVDKFVVSHAGNIGYVYDLESLLIAAKRLADRDLVALIVGDGVARDNLVARASEWGVDNVIFMPFQPHEVVPLIRAASDVQVSLYKKEAASFSMPSKVYEIMASGRPLLASAETGSDVRSLVDDTGCGVGVPPEDPDAVTDALTRMLDDPAARRAMGEVGRGVAETRYSKGAIVTRYEQLFEKLIISYN